MYSRRVLWVDGYIPYQLALRRDEIPSIRTVTQLARMLSANDGVDTFLRYQGLGNEKARTQYL
jgi:hypothetical protein